MQDEWAEQCVLKKEIYEPYILHRHDEMWQKDVPLAEKAINAMMACMLQDYGSSAMEISEENFQRYLKFIPEHEHELARKLLTKWMS